MVAASGASRASINSSYFGLGAGAGALYASITTFYLLYQYQETWRFSHSLAYASGRTPSYAYINPRSNLQLLLLYLTPTTIFYFGLCLYTIDLLSSYTSSQLRQQLHGSTTHVPIFTEFGETLLNSLFSSLSISSSDPMCALALHETR